MSAVEAESLALQFVIPSALRERAGDRGEIRIDGPAASVGEALSLLWSSCPAVRDRVMTELGELRPHINVFVDGENIRYTGGLGAPVRDDAEIIILPAVSGG